MFPVSDPYTPSNKRFGGYLSNIPFGSGPAGGAPNSALYWQWLFQNWSVTYPDWTLPFMKNLKRLGANSVALITALNCTLSGIGTITYSTWKSNMTQLLTDVRALGLQLHVEAFDGQAYVSGNTAAQNFVPVQQALTDLFIPNADIIASIEAGQGESDMNGSVAQAMSASLAGLAKAATSIPIVLSVSDNGSMTVPSAFASSAADLIALNLFGTGSATDYQTMINLLKTGLNTAGGKPVYIGSCQKQSGSPTAALKQAFTADALQAFFGHPDCQGLQLWGVQGTGGSGGVDFSIIGPPSNQLDPTLFWVDTIGSKTFASWGGLNRNLIFVVTQTGTPSITNTAADLPLTAHTQNQSTPTTSGINMTTALLKVCNLSLTGTISLSGDAASQYTISFSALNLDTSTRYTIGTPLVLSGSPSGQAINMTGVLPHAGNYTFSIQAQRTSGSVNATVTALAANLAIGSAPVPTVPGTPFKARLFGETVPWAAAAAIARNPVLPRRQLLLPRGSRAK